MDLFDNAQIYQTAAIAAESAGSGVFQREIYSYLARFKKLDWGDISEADSISNGEAVKDFDFVLAAYETSKGRIWITAESSTGEEYDRITVLFPNEY